MFKSDTDGGSIMSVLFIIIVIWAIFGGGFGNLNNRGYETAARVVDCSGTSNCQVEKQTIINTATTQNLIQAEAAKGREQATSLYIQDQATQLFDCKMRGMEERILMGQTIASKDAVIAAKDAEIARAHDRAYYDARFNDLAMGQERLSCETPKRPEFYSSGFITCGQPIPSNFANC